MFCYLDEPHLSLQNVCYWFFSPLDFDMEWQNGNQLQKLPNQGKETLDVLPFGVNGNDYLATIDEQKLSVYKWMNKKIYWQILHSSKYLFVCTNVL